jgi:hypothetical protein
MLTIDKFGQKESRETVQAARQAQVNAELIDSRKIIDFESARKALEMNDSLYPKREEFKSTLLSNLRTDKSASVAESVVTLILVVIIGLSLLLGLIWGF